MLSNENRSKSHEFPVDDIKLIEREAHKRAIKMGHVGDMESWKEHKHEKEKACCLEREFQFSK
jgi:hypothetical protein